MILTKITAAQNEVALSYHKVRGLCFLAVIFAATIGDRTWLNYSARYVSHMMVTCPATKCIADEVLCCRSLHYQAYLC